MDIVTPLDSGSPRKAYVQCPVYVRFHLAVTFRRAVKSDGFRLGDFARVVIVLGLTYRLLEEGNFAKRANLYAAVQEIGRSTRRAVKRSYPMEKGTRGVWINLRLPRGFVEFVSRYAKAVGGSRNNALAHFFEAGLLLYSVSQRKLLIKLLEPKRRTMEARVEKTETPEV